MFRQESFLVRFHGLLQLRFDFIGQVAAGRDFAPKCPAARCGGYARKPCSKRRTCSTAKSSKYPLMAAKMDDNLFFYRHGLVLAPLQNFHRALTAGQPSLRRSVQVGAELGESREFPILGQFEPQVASHPLMAGICASPPTRDTERPTLIAGRTPA